MIVDYDPWDDTDVLLAFDDFTQDIKEVGWSVWIRDDVKWNDRVYRGATLASVVSETSSTLPFNNPRWWDSSPRWARR